MPEQDIRSTYTDDLSPLAREVLALDVADAYARLLVPETNAGNPRAKEKLGVATEQLMLGCTVADRDEARCILAGLWLWHDWLDDSHRLSQQVHTESGSFWHAILHRREGDFENSKYWYARCRRHPVMAALTGNATTVLNPLPADKSLVRLVTPAWDPNAFVDLVAEVHDRPDDPRHKAAVSLQQLEWRLLFDHCTRAAAGK